MATVEKRWLECDVCGSAEDDVRTRRVTVGNKARWVEVCQACWAPVAQLLEKGRAERDVLEQV